MGRAPETPTFWTIATNLIVPDTGKNASSWQASVEDTERPRAVRRIANRPLHRRHMSTATIPERSLEQRREALNRANLVRTSRSELKGNLKRREVTLAEALLHPSEDVLGMKVVELLLAAPKFGRVKVDKAMRLHHISPSKTIGGLTERQRLALASIAP